MAGGGSRWLEGGWGAGWLGRWLQAVAGGGGMLRHSAVRIGSIGSVRGHRISDTNGSVSDAPRYAVKVLLKQP